MGFFSSFSPSGSRIVDFSIHDSFSLEMFVCMDLLVDCWFLFLWIFYNVFIVENIMCNAGED